MTAVTTARDGTARSAAATMDLAVTGIAEPVPGIRSITLAAHDGGQLPGFVPGSHIVVQAGAHANAYSLTSDGFAPTAYTISVLRVADGKGGSRWLHDHLKVGDTVAVHPPRSAFAPLPRARKHLLVAGGIGVTPIVSHLRSAQRWGRTTQVLYTFRDGHGAHADDIADLAGDSAEFFTDRESFADRLAHALGDQPIGTHLYVCGPAPMIDHVLATAHRHGWPSSRVHLERFGAAALDGGDPFTVTLTRTGRVIDVASGTSLLEALEDNGIDVPSLCRQGVCGECRIPVCGGTPVHRDLFLGDDEKAAGDSLMPCVSRAEKGTMLEVPL